MKHLLILAILATTTGANADIDAATRKAVVDQLSKEMVQRYISKEKALQVAKTLGDNLAKGKYDSLSDGAEFAKALREDANAVCQDAHLRVRYSPEKLPERRERGEPSRAEIEENRRFTKLQNAGFEGVERLPGNIGLIRFHGFFDPEAAERPIRSAMEFVKDTDALIFDIRQNGGGDPETVRILCSYLFDKPTHINTLLFRRGDKTRAVDFVTGKIPGPKSLNKPIYVLVSKRTGSGAEEFAYNLQTQKRGTIIGESTWGGANPGGDVRLTDNFSAFIPVGMAKNPITKTNWEGSGVLPDVKVAPSEALKAAQVLAVKKLLETAKGPDAERLRSVLTEIGG